MTRITEFVDNLQPAPPQKPWERLFYGFCWFVAEKIVLFSFGTVCRQAQAEYNRKKLAAWVDEMPVEPLEPDEQALGYQRQVKLDYSVQYLERCLLMEVGE